jgi:choline dehydrogenase-like flavoprotein
MTRLSSWILGFLEGYAAKELTEKGMRTLVLDRGKQMEHITGYEPSYKDLGILNTMAY